MVTIRISEKKITAKGHANSGPEGHDLACGMASVLLQALELGINKKYLKVKKKLPGDLEYRIKFPKDRAVLLVVMANIKLIVVSLQTLAKENPEHVKVEIV